MNTKKIIRFYKENWVGGLISSGLGAYLVWDAIYQNGGKAGGLCWSGVDFFTDFQCSPSFLTPIVGFMLAFIVILSGFMSATLSTVIFANVVGLGILYTVGAYIQSKIRGRI